MISNNVLVNATAVPKVVALRAWQSQAVGTSIGDCKPVGFVSIYPRIMLYVGRQRSPSRRLMTNMRRDHHVQMTSIPPVPTTTTFPSSTKEAFVPDFSIVTFKRAKYPQHTSSTCVPNRVMPLEKLICGENNKVDHIFQVFKKPHGGMKRKSVICLDIFNLTHLMMTKVLT